jgi:hypothetical protein
MADIRDLLNLPRPKTLTLAQAEAIQKTTQTTPARAAVPPKASSSVSTSRARSSTVQGPKDGRQVISESRANQGNLPPGNYCYVDRRGKTVSLDVGEKYCSRGKAARRTGEPVTRQAGTSCREVIPARGYWSKKAGLL